MRYLVLRNFLIRRCFRRCFVQLGVAFQQTFIFQLHRVLFFHDLHVNFPLVFHSTFFSQHSFQLSTGRSGARMLRPTPALRYGLVYNPRFWDIFIDQSGRSAALRTIIFSYLYCPPTDNWPWEVQRLSTVNIDLYHFSVIAVTVYRPCVTFLAVDTPSVANSLASDSDDSGQ